MGSEKEEKPKEVGRFYLEERVKKEKNLLFKGNVTKNKPASKEKRH
jgi:hypothetical protein